MTGDGLRGAWGSLGMIKVRNYINGQWVESGSERSLPIENPSTGAVIAELPLATAAEADVAVQRAHEAFLEWREVPVPRRVDYLFRLRSLIEAGADGLARILVAEMGKSLPDAHAEMKRVLQNIEAACAAPLLQQGDKMVGCASGIDGETLRVPLGVFAAITPFNFPAMAPFWFIPYAIATGNTLVLKPSELVPLTTEKVAEYIDSLGLPAGVFNLLNGDREAGEALVTHPLVKGVSFVGKTSTCKTVASNAVAAGKRFQVMGSAKNHLVVMPDYEHLDALIRNMSTSCYGCAGQRCMASSVIVAVGDEMYSGVTERFVEDSRAFIVANPLDPAVEKEPMLMGPVISAASRDFIHEMIASGVEEGATLALDGRDVEVPGGEGGYYVGPTVFTDVRPEMTVYKTEIFAPVVCIMKVDSLDEAISLINTHEFSNACSIYTQNGYWAREFKLKVKTGMVGVNVGIPAPVPFLPFGGIDNSMINDIKMQGKQAIAFYTQEKVVVERYWKET